MIQDNWTVIQATGISKLTFLNWITQWTRFRVPTFHRILKKPAKDQNLKLFWQLTSCVTFFNLITNRDKSAVIYINDSRKKRHPDSSYHKWQLDVIC